MTRKWWLLLAAVASLFSAPGCICCNHQAYGAARDVGPECTVPLVERQKTYLFMVNGVTPGGSCGLEGLRDELAGQGYSKVGYGQLVHVHWMAQEIRRIQTCDPTARFVVLGFDAGGPAAAWLANDVAKSGVTVDALVLLDPVGKCAMTSANRQTLVITSTAKAPIHELANLVTVPEAGHFTLPTHPKTVAAVTELLGSVASRTQEGVLTTTVIEWTYEHAPPARPISVSGPDTPPEWNFMLDIAGNHAEPLTPLYTSIDVSK